MPLHDKRQPIEIDQDSVFSKITRSTDKLTTRLDCERQAVLHETYYMMPATNWIVRNAISINDKLSS